MSTEEWLKAHTEICPSNSCLAIRAENLLNQNVVKEEMAENAVPENIMSTSSSTSCSPHENKRQRLDELLTTISPDSLILSDEFLSQWTVEAQEKLLQRKSIFRSSCTKEIWSSRK
jgi:hypothetical protein